MGLVSPKIGTFSLQTNHKFFTLPMSLEGLVRSEDLTVSWGRILNLVDN